MSDPDPIAALCDAIIEITAVATRRRLSPGAATGRRDFASLGVDSVNVFEIILHLETRYSVTLLDTFLFTHRTPADAAQALHDILGRENTPNPPDAHDTQ